MNILQAIQDKNLLRPFLGSPTTWQEWFAALKAIYGLKVQDAERPIIQECTGRNPDLLPQSGFDTVLFLTGRRSGKSRMAAVIAAFEAVLAGHETKLARGETGVVAVISPTKAQSRVVHNYL